MCYARDFTLKNYHQKLVNKMNENIIAHRNWNLTILESNRKYQFLKSKYRYVPWEKQINKILTTLGHMQYITEIYII